jgi:acetyltransferase-like isoleucine patch superfamily enzyme
MIGGYLNFFLFKLKNPSCKIHHTARVSRKTIIGFNCKLSRNSALSSTVKIGNNVKIGEGVKLSNIEVGDNTVIESGVRVVGTGKGYIRLGNECYIGVNNILDNSDNVTIGSFVHLAGPSTALWCHSSAQMCLNSIPLNDKNRDEFRQTAPITIEDNIYIGGNCTIYPGVWIHKRVIVAPNSVVNRDVESNTVVGGVPCKMIKKID